MNKSVIIGVVVVLMLLGGGAAVLFNQKSSVADNGESTSQTDQMPSEPSVKTLAQLIASGVDTKCTFENKMENTESKGTIYVTQGKFRGEIDAVDTQLNTTQKMFMINDGTYMYTWGASANQGIKFKIDSVDEKTKEEGQKYLDTNAELDYSCGPTSIDTTMFTPPTNVNFLDSSAAINPTGGTGTMQCAACEQISDANAKAACKNALKCP